MHISVRNTGDFCNVYVFTGSNSGLQAFQEQQQRAKAVTLGAAPPTMPLANTTNPSMFGSVLFLFPILLSFSALHLWLLAFRIEIFINVHAVFLIA